VINKFRTIDTNKDIIIDHNFNNILPEDSLARFIVDIIYQLDLSSIEEQYSVYGSKAYPPKIIFALIFYCYINGIFSSRQIEKATKELIPVMYITHGERPDHSVISRFRKDFLQHIKSTFSQVLEIAANMNVFKLGDVALDGTKIKANASKHKALSYSYTLKLEKQIETEINLLIQKSEEAEGNDFDGLNIPDEIKRREERMLKIQSAKAKIEARRKVKYDEEKREYNAKIANREKKEKERGRKLGGRKPKEPDSTPQSTDQVNLTDEESRIMPTSGGGFEQCYNAQATVDMDSRLIVENHITQQSNDKQELSPALDKIEQLPDSLGNMNKMAVDSGYNSQANRELAVIKGVDLHVPKGREKHNNFLDSLSKKKELSMKEQERCLFYALRKSTIEPIFGIIKSVIGFTKFSLRGLDAVSGEWSLVCTAYNLKRLYRLKSKVA
jgi:transposase